MIRHTHKCIATFFACAPHSLSPAVGKVSKRPVFLLTLLHSPAVGKVGTPRWGHPLVEFVIVVQMGRFAQDSRACSCIHTHIKG